MLETGWLFLGRAALVWTLAVVLASSYYREAGDDVAMVGGTIGFVLWGVWSFGTLNVEVVSGGSVITSSSPALTLVGVAMAIIPGYLALTGPIEMVARYRRAEQGDL